MNQNEAPADRRPSANAMKWPLAIALAAVAAVGAYAAMSGPAGTPASAGPPGQGRKVGLLLANHGSRSETWRRALLDLEKRVEGPILRAGAVQGIKTAFMEYTEPSIATRLREFDAEGYTDIVLVPVFLTVSPHTFDDIPTIIGQREDPMSMQALKLEKIERYTPRARVHMTPTLDFTDMLRKNVVRRVRELSKDPAQEGLVLIAYGDETYEKDWDRLLESVGEHVRAEVGIPEHSHGWCGHIAHYDPRRTTDAIQKVLDRKPRAVVVPVLVAHDEMFQIKIIGDGIALIPRAEERVAYKPDSILPDPDVEAWVIRVTAEQAGRILASAGPAPR